MQIVCQVLWAALLILMFLSTLHSDSVPRKDAPPAGFKGNVATLILFSIIVALNYGAGSFSLILR